MKDKQSFRLVYPKCPSCNSEEVFLLKSTINFLVVAINVVFGLFLCPPFPYKLACGKCGFVYKVDIGKI